MSHVETQRKLHKMQTRLLETQINQWFMRIIFWFVNKTCGFIKIQSESELYLIYLSTIFFVFFKTEFC